LGVSYSSIGTFGGVGTLYPDIQDDSVAIRTDAGGLIVIPQPDVKKRSTTGATMGKILILIFFFFFFF